MAKYDLQEMQAALKTQLSREAPEIRRALSSPRGVFEFKFAHKGMLIMADCLNGMISIRRLASHGHKHSFFIPGAPRAYRDYDGPAIPSGAGTLLLATFILETSSLVPVRTYGIVGPSAYWFKPGMLLAGAHTDKEIVRVNTLQARHWAAGVTASVASSFVDSCA